MNAYQTSIDLALAGDDTEKVSVLQSLSVHNIDATKMRLWLQDRGLLAYDGKEWFGTIENAMAGLPDLLQVGIRDLKARILMGQPIRTAEPEFAERVLAIIQGINLAIPGTSGLVDSFYALDGGRPFKALTVEQYQQQRDEANKAVDQAAITARITNASALASERISPTDTAEQAAAKWAQAWAEAV